MQCVDDVHRNDPAGRLYVLFDQNASETMYLWTDETDPVFGYGEDLVAIYSGYASTVRKDMAISYWKMLQEKKHEN